MKDREYWDALDAGAGTPRAGESTESPAWHELRSRMASDELGAERARQVREFDDRVGRLFQDVQLPTTLAQRIRTALAESQVGSLAPAEQALGQPPSPQPTTAQLPTAQVASDVRSHTGPSDAAAGRFSRRQLAGVLAAAACLGLLWFGFAGRRSGDIPELTTGQIVQSAMDWMGRVSDQTPWRQVTHLPTGRYKPSRAVAGTPLRFATLGTEWDGRTRLYEYPATDQSQQWCFVFRPSETPSQLAPVPPDQPSGGSGGWNVACWQEGPAVYVLMIRGSLDDYRRAVAPGRNFVSQPAQSIQLVVR